MSAKDYSRLAALIFAVIAALQLTRAVGGWPVTAGTVSIPLGKLDCLRHYRDPCLARF
jgi:hypothetical protein